MLLLVCVVLVSTLAVLLLHNRQYSIVTANIVRASRTRGELQGALRADGARSGAGVSQLRKKRKTAHIRQKTGFDGYGPFVFVKKA